jgi:signal transduction histidine kinase
MSVELLLAFTTSLAFLLLAGVALRRRGFRESVGRWLVYYAVLAGLLQVIWMGERAGWLAVPPDTLLVRLPLYGQFGLALIFLGLSRTFLRLDNRWGGWVALALGAIGLAALIVFDAAQPQLSALPAGLERPQLLFGGAVLGWATLIGGSVWLTARTYGGTVAPLHRNRLKYWVPVSGLMVSGGALRAAGQPQAGAGLELAGIALAAYVVLTHRPPDVRQIIRWTISSLLNTLIAIAVYAAGFAAAYSLFPRAPGYTPVLVGAGLAVVIILLLNPTLRWVQEHLNRRIVGIGYDAGRIVREYGLSISNILNLEQLAALVVGLIRKALGSRYGALFLVDRETNPDGHSHYHLRRVSVGHQDSLTTRLSVTSPIAVYLSQERHPLTQYDLDLLPRFRDAAPAERAWLSNLNTDVYVPIYTKGEWIGLLALGPKNSGDRYFDADLDLLTTLADQTAVALANARLVSDLQEAHVTLEATHHQLQELDKLKSAFLGVVTHELRSPFTNIVFSLQLLERHGLDGLNAEQREQLAQLNSGVQNARAMVDNLVAFAAFLSKQGELRLGEVNFKEVIEAARASLQFQAERKGLTLHAAIAHDLPILIGDRERLIQAVHHLIHNAVKFTGEGGRVTLECFTSPGSLSFEVQDTGVGIPEDRLSGLWDSFTQMADPMQRGVEGLGLGLALVKYVVKAHGGEVWARSQVGAGSAFGFRLPVGGPQQAVNNHALS